MGSGRIGVYGGTFNPVHTAHLILAEEVRERMRLDRILFVPSGRPPHKSSPLPEGERRLEMVRRALRRNPFFSVLDLEVKREGRSFTVDTLRELHRRHRGRRKFFFLIGMDAFREISTWHEAGVLPDLAHFVIFPRPGHPLEDPAPSLPSSWKLEAARAERAGIKRYLLAGGRSLFTVETGIFPLSASAIRRRVRQGRSIKYLVPDTVERYIKRCSLYRQPRKGG